VIDVLATGIKKSKNVLHYFFGKGAVGNLGPILLEAGEKGGTPPVFFVDHFFHNHSELIRGFLPSPAENILFVDTSKEPTTRQVNVLRDRLVQEGKDHPSAVVGIGGGATLDVAKAISNLLANGGHAEQYQGWDLVKVPGIFKVGIPTISGTGAESTRTCVMTNPQNGLKLGMNSDFTVYDLLILDPDLTRTVPRDQYFFTGMDSYIHCIESLRGSYRNAVGDAFSEQSLKLCREVFGAEDMMSEENRARLMVASYLGGCAVASSYVGVLHPFSAGLSVVLGVHHGLANCIVMTGMQEFYPAEVEEFLRMAERQKVNIPRGICRGLSPEQFDFLYRSTIIHEKPLTNALGKEFKKILTREKVEEIFRRL